LKTVPKSLLLTERRNNSVGGVALLRGYPTEHFPAPTSSGLDTVLVRLYSSCIRLDGLNVSSDHFYIPESPFG
jgi:hypothetical protein